MSYVDRKSFVSSLIQEHIFLMSLVCHITKNHDRNL